MKIATVLSGPSVWLDKKGPVVVEDGDFVVVELEDRDDAGGGKYNVRFPLACLKLEYVPPVA